MPDPPKALNGWPVIRLAVTHPVKGHPVKGRGALSNPQGRFEQWRRELAPSDEVAPSDPADPELAPPAAGATRVEPVGMRRAITRNESPDIAFDQSLNPYQGCEHGCIYCYARPTFSFLGLSPGLDFETRIGARTTMPSLLARELDAPGYRCSPINIGSATDPYQPAERELGITRAVLEVLLARRHPFTVVTKGALIERDADLLAEAARLGIAQCFVSISTLDPAFARLWDPRASAPWRRLRAIETLASAGIPVGVLVAPIVPFLNDQDIESIIAAAAQRGAQSAHYTLLRLPYEVRPLFEQWLRSHFPERAERVLARIRDLRGGDKLNDSRFFARMHGQGPWGQLISSRFRLAARRNGLSRQRRTLDGSGFRPGGAQGRLF
ncbi:MAG: PA0069 family radical SAM protein [Burkholderiaceae bacterium]